MLKSFLINQINISDFDEDTQKDIVKYEVLNDVIEELEQTIIERKHYADALTTKLDVASGLIQELEGDAAFQNLPPLGHEHMEKITSRTERMKSELSELKEMRLETRESLYGILHYKTHNVGFVIQKNNHGFLDINNSLDYFKPKIDEFNKKFAGEIITADAKVEYNEATVVLAFDPDFKDQVEEFLFELSQGIVKDYNQAMAKNEKYAGNVDYFSLPDSTEYNVYLRGSGPSNKFPLFANTKYSGMTFKDAKEKMRNEYHFSNEIIHYTDNGRHYELSSENPISNDIQAWFRNAGGSINGRNYDMDKFGLIEVSNLTKRNMLEDNKDLKRSVQRDIMEHFSDRCAHNLNM